MNEKNRKMAFIELDGGQCGVKVQQAFEEAQKVSREKNDTTKVVLTIIVAPDADTKFGKVAYTVDRRFPTMIKSKVFTTQLNKDGLIVAEGKNIIDVLQNELEFPDEPKITLINKKGS